MLFTIHLDNSTISIDSSSSIQLQRVASRCSCQLFFCCFSDMLGTEELEDLEITIPAVNDYFLLFKNYSSYN